MKKSSMLCIMAVLAALLVLAGSASAACSSCAREADWGDTARSFISGTPMSEDPIAFGPKAARAETSQFDRESEAAQKIAENASGSGSGRVILQSINATPAVVNFAAPTKIDAFFAINRSDGGGQGEMQLSANAQIKNSAGSEVAKLPLIRQSAGQYSNNWMADVPPGIYSVDITAFSLEGTASFKDALQIEVLG